MTTTTFVGAHEVDEKGICVWCRKLVEQPDFGCDLKARIVQLEAENDELRKYVAKLEEGT